MLIVFSMSPILTVKISVATPTPTHMVSGASDKAMALQVKLNGHHLTTRISIKAHTQGDAQNIDPTDPTAQNSTVLVHKQPDPNELPEIHGPGKDFEGDWFPYDPSKHPIGGPKHASFNSGPNRPPQQHGNAGTHMVTTLTLGALGLGEGNAK